MQRDLAPAGNRDHIASELLRIRLGHDRHPSTEDQVLRGQESTQPAAVPYEAAHPGTTIEFSFAGSSDLVTQIQNGAPADVFASADTKNMNKLATSDLQGSPKDFAKNTLEIAVAPGNPKKITDFKDLTNAGVQVVTCASPVPCGAATQKVEQATDITLKPVSEEQSVTDVLGKVSSGKPTQAWCTSPTSRAPPARSTE
ncbi:molybdate ABC transporter substrate-binding protein [Sphingomonas sp. LR61]|uniref:molybdate ABC transporter substrate-binding protein n=1 Tax=Sphingomonas sp. LR61 TaxID=3050234 RepID=UPI002FE3792F